MQGYLKDNPVFISISKDALPETIEELKQLLPANSRLWQDDEYHFKLENILTQIKNPTFDNLEYLETKYDKKQEAN
jgi:hypothetical protein